MQINSAKSISKGREILKRYGSWEAVFKAAVYENGVYKVPKGQPGAPEAKPEPGK